MHPRSRSARDEAAGAALALPRRGDEHVRIAWIELHVVHAGPVVYVEDSSPRRAAIRRFVQATLATLAPERTLRRDVHNVGVAGVDEDAADMFAFLEADVLPRATTVGRLVYAVAVGHDALRVVLTRADPDHVRVFRVDRDRARRKRSLAIKDGRERKPGIRGLPDTTRRCGDVPGLLVGRVNRHIRDAA